jgi:hypothetical protein
MSRKINLDPVLKHVAQKLIEDRQTLSRILESGELHGIRGFEEQERLLEHIQASVRALDILEGRVSPDVDDARTPSAPEHPPGPVDMQKLAEALRPNGAAH